MTDYKSYPLEFGDVTPGDDFTRIVPKKRPDGVTDDTLDKSPVLAYNEIV